MHQLLDVMENVLQKSKAEKLTADDIRLVTGCARQYQSFHRQLSREVGSEYGKVLKEEGLSTREKKFFTSSLYNPADVLGLAKAINSTFKRTEYVKDLDNNFERNYVRHNDKNLELSPEVTTQKQLVEEVLKKNRGFALADQHNQEEPRQFLLRNMASFKKSGVDTIYVELHKKPQVDYIMAKSIAELEKARDNMKQGEVEYDLTMGWGASNSRNKSKAGLELVAADLDVFIQAKKQGIKIKAMDINDDRSVVGDMGKASRVAQANFDWVSEIQKDRGNSKSKFIVFCGTAHLEGKGKVDDALGIPVIGYVKSLKDDDKAQTYTHTKGKRHFDFELKAGTDYGSNLLLAMSGIGKVDFEKQQAEQALKPGDLPKSKTQPKQPFK